MNCLNTFYEYRVIFIVKYLRTGGKKRFAIWKSVWNLLLNLRDGKDLSCVVGVGGLGLLLGKVGVGGHHAVTWNSGLCYLLDGWG